MQQPDQTNGNVREDAAAVSEFRRITRHADSVMTTFDNFTRRVLSARLEDLVAIQGEAATYRCSLGFPQAPVPGGMPRPCCSEGHR